MYIDIDIDIDMYIYMEYIMRMKWLIVEIV